ncbi:hypothetical protein F5Y16DRAFT_162934 [Xylariaceae sp. FL0255]|nr:hypothetical protein F5Y16DRAFT_162934 [Xylariaceae sp. FL0255]
MCPIPLVANRLLCAMVSRALSSIVAISQLLPRRTFTRVFDCSRRSKQQERRHWRGKRKQSKRERKWKGCHDGQMTLKYYYCWCWNRAASRHPSTIHLAHQATWERATNLNNNDTSHLLTVGMCTRARAPLACLLWMFPAVHCGLSRRAADVDVS